MAKKLSKAALAEQAEAREKLRVIFASQERPTVHTALRHVSSSGMSRDISLLTVDGDGLRNVTYLAAVAMGETPKDRRGQWVIRVGGCGMDMGFHLVSSLSWCLYQGQERADYVLRQEWA
jgi:hypothetical protein